MTLILNRSGLLKFSSEGNVHIEQPANCEAVKLYVVFMVIRQTVYVLGKNTHGVLYAFA